MDKRQILVVEDEPIVALDLQQRLQRMGYRVPPAVATGEEAIMAAESRAPDLVLMDINLAGEVDGVTAAERIRQHRRVPVVYLTAYSNERTLQRAKVTEPYGYLLKPFEDRELQTTIEVALYKHETEEVLRRAHDELERRVAERTAELQEANESLQREIEERRRREHRQIALQRVREEVWRMQSGADITKILAAMWESLEGLGIPFQQCGINVVDHSADPPSVRTFDTRQRGTWSDMGRRGAEAVLAIWRGGEPQYRPNLDEKDLLGEKESIRAGYGQVQSVLDVPFSHGTLALNSRQPEAFSEADIAVVQELGEVLSEGFRRLEDLQQLAAERERLSVTLRSIAESVVATDADGNIVLINRVAEALTGWTQEESRGQKFTKVFRIIHEKTGQPCESPVEQALASGAGAELLSNAVLIARDGSEHLISASSAPIRDDEGKTAGVVLVLWDVAAQREMEAEQLKSEKLESLGVLAGGIAHDFNNILTTVMGYLSLSKMDIRTDSELYANLTEVEDASLRARDLTHQLLAFSKGGAPVKRTASMSELIRDSATFTTSGSNVRCDFQMAPDLWPVEVDRSQISQVIQNLVLNADQAMPQGGTLQIHAANHEVEASHGLGLKPGRYIRIAVIDHGVGIGEDSLGQIFDPYFTTKASGSGLGLVTSYASVKNHDGHITVESVLGEGTTFTVYLPASNRQLVDGSEGEGVGITQGAGRILVLDDEASIRRLVGDLLERLGYKAEFAREGAGALESYRKALSSGKRFDAVIMDLTIPGEMGGRDAVQGLLALDPSARVIVSSGYSDDPIMANYRRYGFCGVVAKPYDIGELSQVLATVTHTPTKQSPTSQ
jgi:PAS domain S-box-containing protein